MDLFLEDGHLAPESIQLLMKGSLNELESLEISEHLSFCIPCLEQYIETAEQAELMTPPKPLGPQVLKNVRLHKSRSLLRRFVPSAAAACLLVGMGANGLFSIAENPLQSIQDPLPLQEEKIHSFVPIERHLNDATTFISNGINSFFDNLRIQEKKTDPQHSDNPSKSDKHMGQEP